MRGAALGPLAGGEVSSLAYRDVARSTDERSVIALAIPREPASIKLPVLGVDSKCASTSPARKPQSYSIGLCR